MSPVVAAAGKNIKSVAKLNLYVYQSSSLHGFG